MARLFLLLVVTGTACSSSDDGPAGSEADASTPEIDAGSLVDEYAWQLPPGFPLPVVPSDNPMSAAKVELGRYLFYDERLSGNLTYSCASCHRQELAFTDGLAQGVGSTGEVHPRGSMSLANVGYLGRLAWGNPILFDLEDQAVVPMFGDEPVELGLRNMESELLGRLRAVPRYQDLFAEAFPEEADPVSVASTVRAISAFERTIASGGSPYDRWARGEADAISDAAKRGYDLFFSEKVECFHCHGGFTFTNSVKHADSPFVEARFHNTGLYNIGGTGAYPAGGTGIHEVTGRPSDMGKFRAPTLRNIALTAPYMHDGSIATLSEVLDHYAAGGRTIETGPYAGVGSENPYKDSLIVGFVLTEEERADVLAFLDSLTDDELIADTRFADPGDP